jgi:Xaa-Pro aminopeptidase
MKPRSIVILLLFVVTNLVAVRADPPVGEPSKPSSLLELPLSEYKARRKALMKRVREAESISSIQPSRRAKDAEPNSSAARAADVVIVVVGETEEAEDAKYRQSNNFAYLTGVETPHAALILWPSEDKEVLYLPPRNRMEESWTGPKIGPGKEGVEATGFDRVENVSSFQGDLLSAVADLGKRSFSARSAAVYVLDPSPRASSGGPTTSLSRMLRDNCPNSRLKDVAPHLGELRKVKSKNEITLIQKAVDLTADAQAAAIKLVGPGVPEYRLEGAILGAFVGGGGMRAGFPSIVGSGLNSTVLHYMANRRTMQDGELVVIDIGAEYFYYTADITRTLPVNGKFTPRQREMYQLVLDCQTAAAKEFKTGTSTLGSQNRFARDFFRKSKLRAKDSGGVERSMDQFFAHGLGHYMGMDVHDVGDSSKPLNPGEVFTIEPGIYIPSEGFGVRIEDDYLVTPTGLEKLSKNIPSSPDEIEALIAKARNKPAIVSAK